VNGKVCRVCRVWKAWSAYYPRAGARDGYRTDCKRCVLERRAAYVQAHPERVAANKQAWAQTPRGRACVRKRAAAWQRRWRAAHPEEMRAKWAAWAVRHGLCPRCHRPSHSKPLLEL